MLSLEIATLKQRFASGDTTPQDILNQIYSRIEREGLAPVWISTVPKAAALAKLLKAPHGPLWGIPFAVKDNIDVAGMATTCACPAFAYTPDRSATVVELLEAAGAILIGKTNMDQFATGLVGTRTPYGICSSVFNREYISGGSSSGSAVAVAAGYVSFALGTDTAGSGRVPASFNNIVGLKPSKGLVSTRGLVPACRTQDVISVFALSAGDASAALSVVGQYDDADPYARQPTKSIAPQPVLQGFRFGIPLHLEFFGDDEAARLYDVSAARLEALGGIKVTIDDAPLREAARLLYEGGWVAERLAAVEDFAKEKPDTFDPTVGSIIKGAANKDAVTAFRSFYKLAALQRTAERTWQSIDVMLVPTAPTIYKITDVLADPIALNSNLGTYTNFVNLMDLSALAIPAGFRPNGLPFGVTLIGRAFDDGLLLTIGDKLHRAMPSPTLGGSSEPLTDVGKITPAPSTDRVKVAVVGAHLSGQPLNVQLISRNAKLIETTRTAQGYKFIVLPNSIPAKPGLIYDGISAGQIEVEIWELDAREFGSFVALIPPPLGIGTLTLADGSRVKGFICETYAAVDAEDITHLRGWRSWLATRASAG